MKPRRQSAPGAVSGGDLDRPARPSPPPPWRRGFADVSAGKLGMWIFLATDCMGFGGLLLAYAMLRVRAPSWPDPALRFDRPVAAVLTFILLASGATMTAAVAAARRGSWRAARILTGATALAGAVFVAGQAAEFRALATMRHVGLTTDHAAAVFYVITGYHGLHVLVGVLLLAVLSTRQAAARAAAPHPTTTKTAARRKGGARSVAQPALRPKNLDAAAAAGALEVAALYWQFVDLVWIVIFAALYLLPSVTRPGFITLLTGVVLAAGGVTLFLSMGLRRESLATRSLILVPLALSVLLVVVLMLDTHVRGPGLGGRGP